MGADESDVHVFTTQFFSRLEDKGAEAVSSWTSKKGINIFEKKFIFIPVNKDIHWSLFVIVNPGKIGNMYVEEDDKEEVEVPFMLFMDSLRAHKKGRMKKYILEWLNLEAKRLGMFKQLHKGSPFHNSTMSVVDPSGTFCICIYICCFINF